jgi:integrase
LRPRCRMNRLCASDWRRSFTTGIAAPHIPRSRLSPSDSLILIPSDINMPGMSDRRLWDGQIWRRTSKTGQEISIPIHPDLADLLASAPYHDAVTVAATTNGTPWTESNFNSTFIKAIAKLSRGGRVGPGLTFHGLRHTVGTLLLRRPSEAHCLGNRFCSR